MRKKFLCALLLLCFLIVFFASAASIKFLQHPLNKQTDLLQGWFYTWNQPHYGIDYACSLGDDIYASEGGVAMASKQPRSESGKPAYGNFVLIKHDNGYFTLYAHLDSSNSKIKKYPADDRFNADYKDWTPVAKGESIGKCGKSETETVHLHFELSSQGYTKDRLDPYDIKKVVSYYPPNGKNYISLGENHFWSNAGLAFIDTKLIIPKFSEELPEKPKESWWQKIIDFVSKIFKTPENINIVQNSMIPLSENKKNEAAITQTNDSSDVEKSEEASALKEISFNSYDSACGGIFTGYLQYSQNDWEYQSKEVLKSNDQETVNGLFKSKTENCQIEIMAGPPLGGSFCGFGEDRKKDCQEDKIIINGNEISRNYGAYVDGSEKFGVQYYLGVDDKKCCYQSDCGYTFMFFIDAPDASIGQKCMKDFEEMLKTFQIKKDVSIETKKEQTSESQNAPKSDTQKPQDTKAVSQPKSKDQIAGKVTGFVVDQHGNPVKAISYWLEDDKGNKVCYGFLDCSGNLTNAGYLETTTVPKEGEYILKIKGYFYDDFARKIRIPEEGVFLEKIIVNQPSRIKGFFVDKKGDPVAHCFFWLIDAKGNTSGLWSGNQETNSYHFSNDAGHFETLNIADGVYQFVTSRCSYDAGDNQWLPLEDLNKTVTVSGDDIDLGKIVLKPKASSQQ